LIKPTQVAVADN